MFTKKLEKIQLTVGVTCLSIFILAIIIQVACRYLKIPVLWAEEVANFSFVWSVFMGASVMVNQRAHFKFSGLVDKLNKKTKTYVEILSNVLMLLFTVAIGYYGVVTVDKFWNYTWVTIPDFKMGYIWLAIPIAGITMSIYLVSHIVEDIKSLKGEVTE